MREIYRRATSIIAIVALLRCRVQKCTQFCLSFTSSFVRFYSLLLNWLISRRSSFQSITETKTRTHSLTHTLDFHTSPCDVYVVLIFLYRFSSRNNEKSFAYSRCSAALVFGAVHNRTVQLSGKLITMPQDHKNQQIWIIDEQRLVRFRTRSIPITTSLCWPKSWIETCVGVRAVNFRSDANTRMRFFITKSSLASLRSTGASVEGHHLDFNGAVLWHVYCDESACSTSFRT